MRKTTHRYTFEQTAAIGDSGSSVRNATSTAIGSSVDERESCSIVERRDGVRTARRRGNRHRHRRGRRFERFVYQRISRARQSVRRPRGKKKKRKQKRRRESKEVTVGLAAECVYVYTATVRYTHGPRGKRTEKKETVERVVGDGVCCRSRGHVAFERGLVS